MLTYIQDVVTKFGGRYFGSEQEKNAQLYTAEILRKYCSKVDIEELLAPLNLTFNR